MIQKQNTLSVLLLPMFLSAGCTLDVMGTGAPCLSTPEVLGCFSRMPEIPTLEDPEMYIRIMQEDGCHISGYGWGLIAPYTFIATGVDGGIVELATVAGGDGEYTEHSRMTVERSGRDGVLLNFLQYRHGSGGEWHSWPEEISHPYYLSRVECTEE